MSKTPPSRDTLYNLYVTQGLLATEVAAVIGYSRSRVFHFLKQYGIPRAKREVIYQTPPVDPVPPSRPHTARPGRVPGANWLRARYWDDNRNVTDIAVELGVNPNSVTKALYRHGIPIKPRHLAYEGKPKRAREFSASLRRHIMERDGFRCLLCGATDSLEVHHIVPVRIGGKTSIANGATVCVACHNQIGFCELRWVGPLLEKVAESNRTG